MKGKKPPRHFIFQLRYQSLHLPFFPSLFPLLPPLPLPVSPRFKMEETFLAGELIFSFRETWDDRLPRAIDSVSSCVKSEGKKRGEKRKKRGENRERRGRKRGKGGEKRGETKGEGKLRGNKCGDGKE